MKLKFWDCFAAYDNSLLLEQECGGRAVIWHCAFTVNKCLGMLHQALHLASFSLLSCEVGIVLCLGTGKQRHIFVISSEIMMNSNISTAILGHHYIKVNSCFHTLVLGAMNCLILDYDFTDIVCNYGQ